jgi:hypothetical protein
MSLNLVILLTYTDDQKNKSLSTLTAKRLDWKTNKAPNSRKDRVIYGERERERLYVPTNQNLVLVPD